jgi:RHS repeat-associated protein
LYEWQTGLVRFGARDYDPFVGRWTAKDPIGFAGGETGFYTYVGNDPVNRADPSGLGGPVDWVVEKCLACFDWMDSAGAKPWLDTVQGFGDGASLGLNGAFRPDHLQQFVDTQSVAYRAGFAAGATTTVAATAGAGAEVLAARSALVTAEFAGSGGLGFATFDAFKRYAGRAGDGLHWHHLVEQTESNVARFGAEAIQNTSNLVRMAANTHVGKGSISAYYSSVQFFTDGLTVRAWLASQSFEAQREFGIETFKRFGGSL